MRTRFIILPALVAGLALITGCSSQSAVPAPSSAAPSATQTEAAEPVASRVVIGGETVEVIADDDQVMSSVRYFDPATEMVEALTEAFGAEPVVSADAGGIETPPGTRYTWGKFAIVDRDIEQAEPYLPAINVYAESAEESGIRIEAAGGFAVGEPAETAAAALPNAVSRYAMPDGTETLVIRAGIADIPPTGDVTDARSWAVAVLGTTDGPISRLVAPSGDFGV